MEITKEQAFDYLIKRLNFQGIRDGSGRASIYFNDTVNVRSEPIAKFIYDIKCNMAENREREQELKELARLKQKYEGVSIPEHKG